MKYNNMYGKTIKECRLEKGWSQKYLAGLLLISPATVGKYEREEVEPSIAMIIRICKVFEITSDYLLGIDAD